MFSWLNRKNNEKVFGKDRQLFNSVFQDHIEDSSYYILTSLNLACAQELYVKNFVFLNNGSAVQSAFDGESWRDFDVNQNFILS